MGWLYILGARMRSEKEARNIVLADASPFVEVTGEREKSKDSSPLKVKDVQIEEAHRLKLRFPQFQPVGSIAQANLI